LIVADTRVEVLLFDEDVNLARALARALESEAVGITVASDVDQLRERLSDSQATGLIVCSDRPEMVEAIASEVRPPARAPEIFRAETLTPLWELQAWLARLMPARPTPAPERALASLIGQDSSIRALCEQVRRVAHFSEMSVLITGETGTGKELVAQAIHQLSCPSEPFISVNCAAIPASLFEAELFGFARGAFTDAEEKRAGLLEQAEGGTLFLDEVGELPLALQPKLLRSLETRRFRRVGARREQVLRARVVSATHVHLLESAETFRTDLYFRIAGYAIHCPALRARKGDIAILADHFLDTFCRASGLGELAFAKDAIRLLSEYDFLGNVRELRGMVETLAMGASSPTIGIAEVERTLHPSRTLGTLRPSIAPAVSERAIASVANSLTVAVASQLVGPRRPFRSLGELEKHVILAACAEARGSTNRAAQILGLPRSTLRDKLRRYQEEDAGVVVGSR
jgi:DNA-binding NtrC family response regulator